MEQGLKKKIDAYRKKSFCLDRSLQLKNQEDAIEFINRRKFALFHPASDVIIPSLWTATAGDRPVPNEHDDPGHITWHWKDNLLDKSVWYYGRLIRKRMTLVSFDFVPNFYALSSNFGDYENDYLVQYKAGTLIHEAKLIYETLLEHGPLNTLELRKRAGLGGTNNQYRFTKGVNKLQTEMKILPTGIAEVGRWNYSFIYDIVPRRYPEIETAARVISTKQAEINLVLAYLQSVGGATEGEIQKIFSWTARRVKKVIKNLTSDGETGVTAIVGTDLSEPIYAVSEILI